MSSCDICSLTCSSVIIVSSRFTSLQAFFARDDTRDPSGPYRPPPGRFDVRPAQGRRRGFLSGKRRKLGRVEIYQHPQGLGRCAGIAEVGGWTGEMAHLLCPRVTLPSQLVPVALPLPDLPFNVLRAFRLRLRLTPPHDFQQRYLQPRPRAVEFGQNLRPHRRIERCLSSILTQRDAGEEDEAFGLQGGVIGGKLVVCEDQSSLL